MPSCLGICIEKNLIKYAKLTKDKASSLTTLEAFGVKFYDSLGDTIKEIVAETQSETVPLCVGLNTEDYTSVKVFSSLSPKDKKSLVNTNFNMICEEKEINSAVLEMRYVIARNTGEQDSDKAICVAASKTELTNLGQVFGQYKLTGITSMGLAAANLLRNRGAGEKSVVINIEDDTKITVFNNGEIADMITVSLGMDEVFSRLAEKYNSYSRAYDACKGASAYVGDGEAALDDETKEINEILLPILYDLKQRITAELYDYKDVIRNIYITGTGVIINNIDLYFQEVFPSAKCEILVPYFINKDRTNLKDVLEVNNALSVAAYGVDGIDKETDFYANTSYLKSEVNKQKNKTVSPKEIVSLVNNWLVETDNKMKRKVKSKNRKKSVAFENEVEQLDQLGGAGETAKTVADTDSDEYYDPFEEWLVRVAISSFVAFAAYTGVSHYAGQLLNEKITLANQRIASTSGEIAKQEEDITFINAQSEEYRAKTDKLTKIIETIKTKEEVSFDIPNLLSRLMFSIPDEVKVTSVVVGDKNHVVVSAESGRYSQLGYFVSRLKLEGILEDVEMKVISMDTSSIKIIINGVLP